MKIMYQTNDGQLFDSKEKAEKHEKKKNFESWYETHPVLDNKSTPIPVAKIMDWLAENKDMVKTVI